MAKKINKKVTGIAPIRVYYDSFGNTLNVWFDDPAKEYISEEVGDEVILNKDRRGRVIGFEKLNFSHFTGSLTKLPIESMVW